MTGKERLEVVKALGKYPLKEDVYACLDGDRCAFLAGEADPRHCINRDDTGYSAFFAHDRKIYQACVDVEGENPIISRFRKRFGSKELNRGIPEREFPNAITDYCLIKRLTNFYRKSKNVT